VYVVERAGEEVYWSTYFSLPFRISQLSASADVAMSPLPVSQPNLMESNCGSPMVRSAAEGLVEAHQMVRRMSNSMGPMLYSNLRNCKRGNGYGFFGRNTPCPYNAYAIVESCNFKNGNADGIFKRGNASEPGVDSWPEESMLGSREEERNEGQTEKEKGREAR
jgi:hypothetical protein